MRLLTKLLVASCIFAGPALITHAQEEQPTKQLLMVHIDHVIGHKAAQYEEANKAFNAMLAEHELKGADTWTFQTSEGDFMHVGRISNMADLDENPFASVQEKVGKEAWAEMYSGFDGTYMEHESFLATAHYDYSHNSDQSFMEGMNYRVWEYHYYEEKDGGKVLEMAKKWKALYESKNIESGYTIFTAGMGHPGPVIVVGRWAKSPEAYYAQQAKVQEAFSEEGKKLGAETSKLFYKHEKVDGWFRPDLSYITEPPVQASNN